MEKKGFRLPEKYRLPMQIAIVAAGYYYMARLGLEVAYANTNASPVWPSSAAALAALLFLGWKVFPGILLGAFAANMRVFYLNSVGGMEVITPVSFMIAVGNTLEAFAGFYLLKRFVGEANPADRIIDVFKFVAIACCVCLVPAVAGPMSICFFDIAAWELFPTMWFTWWIGDMMGILTVIPFFLAFYRQKPHRPSQRSIFEFTAFLLILFIVEDFIFDNKVFQHLPLTLFVSPLLVWGAFRFRMVGMSVMVLLTLGFSVSGTAHGYGPFSSLPLNQSLLLLQIFLGVKSIMGLILVAALKERDVAEEAYRENERRYLHLIENSMDLIALLDRDGKIVYATPKTTQILGYPLEEYVGKNIFDFIHPDDKNDRYRDFARTLEHPGKLVTAQCRFRHRDGGWRWVEGSGINLLDEGSVRAVVVNYRDITERKVAEERHRYIVESAMDAVISIDSDGKIIEWNRQAEMTFGWSKHEVLGKALAETIVPSTFRQSHMKGLDHYLKTGEGTMLNKRVETVGLHRHGHEFPIELSITPLYVDGKTIFSAFIRDITDRKRAEERIRLVVEASPSAMIMTDKEGRIALINAQTEHLFGYSRNELIGQNIDMLVPERFRLNHVFYRRDFFNAPKARPMGVGRDLFGLRKDGTEVPIEIGLNPIETSEGLFVLAAVADITQRKEAEKILEREKLLLARKVTVKSQELLETQQQLKQAHRLADIGTLAATVAHELRNPLGVIQMAAYNIKRKFHMNNKHLMNIEKKVLEGNQIINNLLNYSRIKKPVLEKFDILEVVEECVANLKARIQSKKIVFITDYDIPFQTPLEGDPVQIKEVLNNILMNACQSIDKDQGQVKVTVRMADQNFLDFCVEDNGAGIDPADLEKVFDPFFTRKSKGTGLGLTICNELVTLHHGRIKITSDKDIGTKVNVYLPLTQS